MNLAQSHPEVSEMWHPTLNHSLSPEEVSAGSSKRVWWTCPQNHAYDTIISNRIKGGRASCPICSGKRVAAGVNDLATVRPDIAAQWHPTLNKGITPQQFTRGSKRKVWWLCSEDHKWEASITDRTIGRGCPYCAGKHVVVHQNDLASQRPNIARQWHPSKNGMLTPEEVTVRNDLSAWWRCDFGHEWRATVANRTASKGTGCPVCSGSVVISGANDLLTIHPDIAALWHLTKNKEITPQSVSPGSGRSVWWKCELDHEWLSSVKNVVTGSRCPYCANKSVLAGFNDLATTNTTLASTWHPTLNAGKSASEVTQASNDYAWWQCDQGHAWQTWVYARAAGNGCPSCNPQSSKGEQEVYDWLVSLGVEAKQRVVGLLMNRQEVDIYLPGHNFAIEFNGLYWHSESNGKGSSYHRDKVDAAKASGIQLFHLWEDDWRDRKSIVQEMILHRLGLSTRPVVYARKARITELTYQEASNFLVQNHIQGPALGSLYIGLLAGDDQEIVAVMVMKRMPGDVVYLERYATSLRVPGGFTRLLKYAEKALQPRQVVTFADCSISHGDVYEKNGFVLDKVLPADYSYYAKSQPAKRSHKFNFRIKRFKNDPALLWEEGLSERQLADLNGIIRIWDAGKLRYVKDF